MANNRFKNYSFKEFSKFNKLNEKLFRQIKGLIVKVYKKMNHKDRFMICYRLRTYNNLNLKMTVLTAKINIQELNNLTNKSHRMPKHPGISIR